MILPIVLSEKFTDSLKFSYFLRSFEYFRSQNFFIERYSIYKTRLEFKVFSLEKFCLSDVAVVIQRCDSCGPMKHQLCSKEATVVSKRCDSCGPMKQILMPESMTPEK